MIGCIITYNSDDPGTAVAQAKIVVATPDAQFSEVETYTYIFKTDNDFTKSDDA